MDTERFKLEYYGLSLCASGPASKPGALARGSMMAGFYLTQQIEHLFPYINTVADKAELYAEPSFIKFRHGTYSCILYPAYGLATPFYEQSEAHAFMKSLITFLADIHADAPRIQPNHKIFRRVSVIDILKLLPKTNCRKCGFSSCVAFAAMLGHKETSPDMCPYLGNPIVEQAVYPVYDNDGKLKSTVIVDIDSKKMVLDLENRKESLNKKINSNAHDVLSPGNKSDSVLPAPLTEREQEVLRTLAHGVTNKEIASQLNISPHTVKSHVIHIFNKLGVNDRTQAAVWAARHNLV